MAHVVVTPPAAPKDDTRAVPVPEPRGFGWGTLVRYVVLALGAVVFLFPFYYMLVGSFQKKSDTSIGGAFPIGGWTVNNYKEINSRVDLVQSLANSGIFTGGVILCTVVFGVLAGYALAVLHFRGRGSLFAAMLLVAAVLVISLINRRLLERD